MTNPRKRLPWQKILYGNSGYPDNYTDPSFLKELQKNKNITPISFTTAIRGVSKLNAQLSCVTIFLIIFYALFVDAIRPNTIVLCSTIATFAGYLLYSMQTGARTKALSEDVKTVLSVLVFGYIFSPLLHTLTDSISTDTIFTMTFVVLIVHLVFFDYGLPAFIISKAISLNAAIFGSICLASRLATSFHAFTLLVVSAEFFALLPILMKAFWSPWLVVPLAAICMQCLYALSVSVFVTYIVIGIFIQFVCPYVFVYQQKYKNNIHGPWDEAIVKDLDLHKDCDFRKAWMGWVIFDFCI